MDDVLVSRKLLKRAVAILTSQGFSVWSDLAEDLRSALDEQDMTLDERMKSAGMFSIEEMMAGPPIDSIIRHSGVCDMASYGEWLDIEYRSFTRMQARMELDGKEDDELYEWVLAHAAVFRAARVNFKAALAGEVVALRENGRLHQRLREEQAYVSELAGENTELERQLTALRQPVADEREAFEEWCWTHDHFTDGKGVPLGWLPFHE